jgi:hypothetical protein
MLLITDSRLMPGGLLLLAIAADHLRACHGQPAFIYSNMTTSFEIRYCGEQRCWLLRTLTERCDDQHEKSTTMDAWTKGAFRKEHRLSVRKCTAHAGIRFVL